MQPNRILVPVDFSECCRAALKRALELAAAFEASVDLLHVGTLPMYISPSLSVSLAGGTAMRVDELTCAEAKRRMEEFLDGLDVPARVATNRRVVVGETVPMILEAATEYDLVVIGTHGRSGLNRWFLGSIAERVIRSCPCPALAVRGDDTSTFPPRRLMVPVDFSPGSKTAYALGRDLAKRFSARLHVLHVAPRLSALGGTESLVLSSAGSAPERYEDIVQLRAIAELDAFLADARSDEDILVQVEIGRPVDTIAELSQDVDLLVMGTHSGGGLARLTYGSVTERVLRRTTPPILTVRG